MSFAIPFWSPAQASAILFDWDGIIADTKLDFSGIRKKYYGGRRAMLLEDAVTLPPEVRASLMRDLEELEMEGAYRSRPVPGIHEVLDWVNSRGIPWGVVSRNCRASIEAAAATTGVALPAVVRSRDDGDSVKPDPKVLLESCRKLGAKPKDTLFIGDFIYDMVGARRTGMRGALVRNMAEPDWEPWLECSYSNMGELLDELKAPSELIPWEYQEAVSKFGPAFLRHAHEITLPVPLDAFPNMVSWILAAASLGVGHFILPGHTLSPATWKQNPGFDISCMGLDLGDAVSALLSARFPFAGTVSANEPGPTPSPAPPNDAALLENYLKKLIFG